MATAIQNAGVWSGLSRQIAETVETVQENIVTVFAGGRSTSSGVVWRPGVVVTVRQGMRRGDSIKVGHHGEPLEATLAGADAGTDLAVLRVNTGAERAIAATTGAARVGELVLAVGRSARGDISASAGIVARLGSGWRSWRGGQIDSLIRPDLRLYVGQAGSALVNEGGRGSGHQQHCAGAQRGHHGAGGHHRSCGRCHCSNAATWRGPFWAPQCRRSPCPTQCARTSAKVRSRGFAGAARGAERPGRCDRRHAGR